MAGHFLYTLIEYDPDTLSKLSIKYNFSYLFPSLVLPDESISISLETGKGMLYI